MRGIALVNFMIVTLACSAQFLEASWKTLAPIPDPVGFAGMFAGVSHGRLLAGGGSQFLDKPLWEGGKKSFGDRVYVLNQLEGSWQILPDKLPETISHAASASWRGRIYVVGGINETDLRQSAHLFHLEGDKLHCEPLPDLPHPLAYGAAAIVDQVVLYVVGGATTPALNAHNAECWQLPLTSDGNARGNWEKMPDFPGEATFALSAATGENGLYVFGGARHIQDANGKPQAIPSRQAYRYDPEAQSWTKLADLPQPRMAPVSPSALTPKGEILIAGGFGKIVEVPLRSHPGFEIETFLYAPATNTWRSGPPLPCERHVDPESTTSPGPEPMIAAPAAIWEETVIIVGGEVRPATRTTAVVALPLRSL